MTMQINENYAQSRTGCAERMKEKQAVPNVEKAKETEEAKKAAESQNSDLLSEPKDVYISSEESMKESAGVYRIGQDENGSRKIFFDDPQKAERADKKEDTEDKKLKADENSPQKPEEACVCNTDKVDQEIKNLKEKIQELEKRIRSASGDDGKIRELEKQLAQAEQELSQKDNDTYRKQHSEFS